jgi:hypothetical protein
MTEIIINCVKYIYDAMGVLVEMVLLGGQG